MGLTSIETAHNDGGALPRHGERCLREATLIDAQRSYGSRRVEGAGGNDVSARRGGSRIARLAVIDGAAFAVILVGSMVLRFGWPWPNYPADSAMQYLLALLVAIAVALWSLSLGGFYAHREWTIRLAGRAFVHLLAAGFVTVGLSVVSGGGIISFPTVNLGVFVLLGSMAVVGIRLAISPGVSREVRDRTGA